MVKRKTSLLLKKGSAKPTVNCPHCSAEIDHVDVVQEQHGSMDIGGEIKYDLDAENNGSPRYLCPVCQEEIDEEILAAFSQQ